MDFKPKSIKHPVPWMESKRVISSHDLHAIISPGGVSMLPSRPIDEVFPNIYIGEHSSAIDVAKLQKDGFTHVLNAAHGKGQFYSNTNHVMYKKSGIKFLGIPAEDSSTYNMMAHFHTSADFIHSAVKQTGGKILVHCRVGASRSATLVLAYLILKQNMNLSDAVATVRAKREISPNNGFLNQLCKLQQEIDFKKEEKEEIEHLAKKQKETTPRKTQDYRSKKPKLNCFSRSSNYSM